MRISQRLVIDHVRTGLFVGMASLIMATQSRGLLGGVGLGELAALGLIVLTAPVKLTAFTQVRLLGVVAFVLGFVVGGLNNAFADITSNIAEQDLLAVIFSLACGICAVNWLRTREAPLRLVSFALTLAVLIQLIPLVVMAFGVIMPAWLTDSDEPGLPFVSRYIGFSDNPNQLGLLLCAYPFLLVQELKRTRSLATRVFLGTGLVAGLVLAALIRSNTVFAAYILGATVWMILSIIRWPERPARKLGATRKLLLVSLLLGAGIAFIAYASVSIEKTGDSDANGRFQRWTSAYYGIMEAAALGVGPGGQSGETGPFQGEEAHNLLLDVMLQGGFLSVAAYLFLVFGSAKRALALGSITLICVLIAILTQQVAHYTARQPLSWLYLFLPFAVTGGCPRARGSDIGRGLSARRFVSLSSVPPKREPA